MAEHQVLTIDCPTPSAFSRPCQYYHTTHAVVPGHLTAIWVQASTLPASASGPNAAFDANISPYDCDAYFTDGTRTLVFTPRARRHNKEYVLMGIYLEDAGAPGHALPLWRWHLVVGEHVAAPPAPHARPSMRRDDRKLLRRTYFLEEGGVLRAEDVQRHLVNPKVALMNGSKWVLEVRLDVGMDWSEPEEDEDEDEEGKEDEGQESDMADSVMSPE